MSFVVTDLLQPSPYKGDQRELIGRVPEDLETGALRSLGHPEKPMKAIRAKCLDCVGGSPGEVRKCVSVSCPLWPFRMGVNPFYGK